MLVDQEHGEPGRAAAAFAATEKRSGRSRHHAKRFTPIYIQYKAKVPPLTLEIDAGQLNPLALGALGKLPRHANVPILRSITKADAQGFTFVFRVDPSELTPAQVPLLLEKWGEKYEVAKAKAGLGPKPPAPPVEIKPRMPAKGIRKGAGEEGDELPARSSAPAQLAHLVVGQVIRQHDAAVMKSALSTRGNEADGDPLQGDHGEPYDESRAAAPAVVGGLFSQDFAPMPELPDDSTERASRAGNRAQSEPTATAGVDSPSPVAPVAPVATQPADLAPWHLSWPEGPPPLVAGWVDPNGQIWYGLSHLQLLVDAKGRCSVELQALDLADLMAGDEDGRARALTDQGRARELAQIAHQWLSDLVEPLLLNVPAKGRAGLLRQACADIERELQHLEAMLLDMQMARSILARVERHRLGLPDWALAVGGAVSALAQLYTQFCTATPPAVAMSVLDRWCASLVPYRRTAQLGLFADPQTDRLQRQISDLVQRACQWKEATADPAKKREKTTNAPAPDSTRTHLARVLTVWVDAVQRNRIAVQKVTKNARRGALISAPRPADFQK